MCTPKGSLPCSARPAFRLYRLLGLPTLLAALSYAPAAAQDALINEFLAVGGDVADEDGDFPDWIELHNPSLEALDLDGWYLTDDPGNLRKWRFPKVILDPSGFLLVFASDKDRREADSELHANFRLSGSGEFLALVWPDGVTIRDASSYPPQYDRISYGVTQDVAVDVFLGEATPTRFWIPSSSAVDSEWFLPLFDDASWPEGTTRVGYDTEEEEPPAPGEQINLALNGTATQSTTGWAGDASRAIDGNTSGIYNQNSITHTAQGDPSPWWQVELETTSALDRIVLWNRSDCCSRRLSNFRVSVLDDPQNEVFSELYFTDGFDFPSPGAGFEIPLPAGTEGRTVKVELLGPNADGELYLSLAEVQVFEGVRGYRRMIDTDLESAMLGTGSSAYIRAPFRAEEPGALNTLTLKIKYDDGFVAYLNGEEVARRNAPPGLPAWNSRAAEDRADTEAAVFEEINLTAQLDLLAAGDNVLAIHGLNVRPDDDDFLVVFELQGASIDEEGMRYFPEPTPRAANSTPGVLGFVADTQFSVDRGYYEEPFDVEITTETEGATIRYTLDGSLPTETAGILYDGPIRIETTTVLRAAAFLEGFGPTNVDTQTYIFAADVARQTGAGFPASWGGTAADYQMDPNVVDDPRYRDTIVQDLQTIPTLSIVMETADLFGPSGLYSNTQGRGEAWERPCSMELIYPEASTIAPDRGDGYQVNCGLRIFGYGWRSHSASLKHAFRLFFRRKYGPAKLSFPFFPDWPVESFDNIVLRSQGSRGWNDFRTSIENTQYIRDAWARYTARDMGKLTTSSTFVNLYLNGLYWGLYNPVERPDADFMAEHLGGKEEDYDALNARVGNIEVIDGGRAGWDTLLELALSARDRAVYEDIQEYLDVPDLIDYMLIQFYTCNRDWPGSNGNNLRVAGGPGDLGGYKSFCWDMEYSIWNATDNVLNVNTSYASPATLYARLRANTEFRVEFGDQAHRHLFHGGALTPEKTAARWMDRAREIDRAIVGESARWGDRRREPPYTRDVEWIREQNRLLTTFFPQRTEVLLGQLRQASLYPDVEAPAFNQHGGPIEPGFWLTLNAPAGEIFYSLDGIDPRLPGGGLSPEATSFDGETERVTLLPSGADVRVLVPADGSLGLDWTRPDFDDGAWLAGQTGVGFETASGYEDLITLDIEPQMHEVNSSVYLRLSFQLEGRFFDGDQPVVGMLRLRMKYDDGYVAYLNGEEVASRNAPAHPEWDSRATTNHSDTLAVVFEAADLGEFIGALRPGRNVLAIHGLNTSAGGGDMLILPELDATTTSGGILLEDSAHVVARARRDGSWSALNEAIFFVDTPLRITEIMYHPPDPEAPENSDPDDFEFLELKNTGEEVLDLTEIRITGGIRFAFVEGDVDRLDPGALVVVVKDRDAFASRYATAGMQLAGEYAGNLSNAGENVRLEGRFGEPILDFRYDDSWHPSTDGEGHSLVHLDPLADRSTWGEARGWRPSELRLGTPGVDDSVEPPDDGWQVPGDINQDSNLNLSDAVSLLGFLFIGAGPILPCGDGTLEEDGNVSLLDANGDTRVDLTDAIYALNFLFLGGPSPVLGTQCTSIPGCPDVCR